MKTDTQTLIEAMRILSRDIQSEDGVANAAIAEAAERLQEQQESLDGLTQVIKSQKQTNDALVKMCKELLGALEKIANCNQADVVKYIQTVDAIALDAIDKAKGTNQ